MMQEKQQLSGAEIEAQAAFELPDQEMMALINVTLVDVLRGNEVAVQIPVRIAATVCGIDANVLVQQQDEPVTCEGTVDQLPRAFR